MLLLGEIGIGLMGTMLVGGAIVSSEGFIHVRVHEKQPNGTHLSFVVPAMIMPLAARVVPRHDLKDAAANLQQFMPVVDATLSGLADCPDGLLVEVVDSDTHVTVVKSGGSIVFDADDPGETVHLAVPLQATKATVDAIAAANGPS